MYYVNINIAVDPRCVNSFSISLGLFMYDFLHSSFPRDELAREFPGKRRQIGKPVFRK